MNVYQVRITALVTESEMDCDDTDVPQTWETTLPNNSSHWSNSQRATYILDLFHQSIPIAMLENFDICIFNENGDEIWEEI